MLQVLEVLEAISLPETEYVISNADFIQMRIACTVTFDTSGDEEQLAEQLNTDLQLYLSPWIKNNAFSAAPGPKINASAAHAFIQGRPYIRRVKNVQCQLLPGSYWGETGTADDYLIIPAERHDIKWNIRLTEQAAESPVDGLRIGETFYLTD